MASQTVRVKGLRELNRAFKGYADDSRKELQAELRKIAEPVAATARQKAAPYGAATSTGFAAGARVAGAVVRQRRKKTTGHHPEFPGILMRKVLLPALAEHEERIIREVNDLFDRLDRKHRLK